MDAASHPYHVTLISTKPLFQFILCSTYWIQVIIPKLPQLFRKVGKIFRSWRPALIFFRQIRTLSPCNLQTAFLIHLVFNILDASINSQSASIFLESAGKYLNKSFFVKLCLCHPDIYKTLFRFTLCLTY